MNSFNQNKVSSISKMLSYFQAFGFDWLRNENEPIINKLQDFDFDESSVVRTCSVTFHGNMYILGESISVVKGCRLFNTGFRSFTVISFSFRYSENLKKDLCQQNLMLVFASAIQKDEKKIS